MKILIIRFSSIGDIVLTSPIIRCVKLQLPDAEIHFLTKKKFASLAEANPHIDHLHVLEEDGLAARIQSLQKEKFDFIADLHNSLRSRYVRFRLASPSGTFPKYNMQKWLMTTFKINRLPDVHIVDRYFEAVKKLGVSNDQQGLEYHVPDSVSSAFSSKIPSSPYIVFAIGGTHATKRLPDDKILDVCKRLTMPVILLGGKEDAATGEKIASFCGRDKVINRCSHLSLHESAIMIQHAHSVISHDTGMMHIAAAFKKRIISVWGNTVPDFGMYPYLPGEGSFMAEVKGLPCRPCSKLGYPACPLKHFNCMNLQETDLIASKASDSSL